MRELQDPTESVSSGELSSKDRDFEPAVDWEEVEFTQYRKNKDVDAKLIRLANNKTSLASILLKYNISFIESYSPSGWTHKARCPFPDHRDSSPSFGYNPEQGIFNCFGCLRRGGAVQFISSIENTPPIEVAKRLLADSGPLQEIVETLANEPEKEIDNYLFEFSSYVCDFLSKHKDNIKALPFVEAITWSLDVYLSKNVMRGEVKEENVQARLSKLKEHLDSFQGDSNE
jgi:hypothetical protein